jgi:DNA-binding CsgD family transcriptional regulator
MLDSAPERNRLLASLISHHGGLVARQATNEDDMQDLLVKLLTASPDFLVPELAGYEIGQLDARIDAVEEKLSRARDGSKRHTQLLAQLGKLHQERDQITGGPWVRTVLFNMAKNRYRDEARRAEIIRERGPELAARYSSGIGPSAEWVVLRKLEDEDIRRRILGLPPKLAQVALMRYAGYSCSEIAGILGISADAVWKRAERIRSSKVRAVLGL